LKNGHWETGKASRLADGAISALCVKSEDLLEDRLNLLSRIMETEKYLLRKNGRGSIVSAAAVSSCRETNRTRWEFSENHIFYLGGESP
jgi:hypothetical protein